MRFCFGKGTAYPPVMPETHTAGHWLIRAEDARTTADRMHDPTAKRMMLGIAAGYDKLARHAAVRASTKIPAEEKQDRP
jgi:hypothetical protein